MSGRTIKVHRDLRWLPGPNECHVVLSSHLPPRELITSVHAFAFQGGALLMTRLTERDWDIPGGHIEPGEEPLTALEREVYEEAAAVLDGPFLFAHNSLRLLGPAPAGYRYPCPVSYQLFYCGRIQRLDVLDTDQERTERGLFPPDEAQEMRWVRENADLYRAALAACRRV